MIRASIAWNAKQIAKAMELGSLSFDNAIQRKLVWDMPRKALFVDTLIRDGFTEPIYTERTNIDAPAGCKKGSKIFDVFDGSQRCHCINSFKNNEFALVGCKPFTNENGEDVDLNGKTYDELPEFFKDAFDSYTLTVYYVTDASPEEIAEAMARLNNGKPLTGIESARIKAKNLPAIMKLAAHPLFTENMSATAINGFNNEDIVIKTALQLDHCYELSSKNVKGAYETFLFDEEQCNRFAAIFDATKAVLDIIKNTTKKGFYNKLVSKTNLVNIIYFMTQNKDGDYEKLSEYLTNFFDPKSNAYEIEREDYFKASTDGTNHSGNVSARNSALCDTYANEN